MRGLIVRCFDMFFVGFSFNWFNFLTGFFAVFPFVVFFFWLTKIDEEV